MFDVKHNFDRLIEVLWNEEPDRLPFYEHLVDNEVIEAITGEPVTKLEIYDPGIARLKEEGPKIMRRIRRFAKALIKFYRGMGYDYIPFEAPLRIVRTNIREGTDIAQLSRRDTNVNRRDKRDDRDEGRLREVSLARPRGGS